MLRQCELVRSPLSGQSATTPIDVQQCFLAASPATGNVTTSGSVAQRWLGRAAVLPIDPPAGTFVDLHLDLQPATQLARPDPEAHDPLAQRHHATWARPRRRSSAGLRSACIAEDRSEHPPTSVQPIAASAIATTV